MLLLSIFTLSFVAKIHYRSNPRMEPYLRKAIQSLVREHDPAYLTIDSGKHATEGESREFWIGWYGMPIIKK